MIYIKYYLRNFFFFGIVFWVLMYTVESLTNRLSMGINRLSIMALFYGGFMSLTLSTINILSVRQMPGGKSDKALRVHQLREFELPLDYNEAFERCLACLHIIGRNKIKMSDRPNGRIEARTKWSRSSFGELISFTLSQKGDAETVVRVSSRPILRITILDYGKNFENVEKLLKLLTQQSAA